MKLAWWDTRYGDRVGQFGCSSDPPEWVRPPELAFDVGGSVWRLSGEVGVVSLRRDRAQRNSVRPDPVDAGRQPLVLESSPSIAALAVASGRAPRTARCA